MRLKTLSLKDRNIFERYLEYSTHALAVYSFANIYIWKKLYDISWEIIDGNLCVFFQDKIGVFLYISALGKEVSMASIKEAFCIMDGVNANREISRIENVEEKDTQFYRKFGFDCVVKSVDYVCKRTDLANLSGDKFKSKRASCNYFRKHYPQVRIFPYSPKHKDVCLGLYRVWAAQRKSKEKNPVYTGMIDDSLTCLEVMLENTNKLGVVGRLVSVGNEIKAFTFGYHLNKDTFCILYEVTDLTVKGLAQFIFCEFCRELKEYRYINIMDDSGLKNLARVKLSYHPEVLVNSYIVKRRDS